MNEQELADLFSSQIDRLLGGESAVDLAVNGDLPLLALGQQLTEISFQPSPTAQAAFQSQLASWFGSMGAGLSTTTAFGLPKILLMSLGAALAVIGAGLGVVVLISLLWTGAFFDSSNESRPEPGVTPQVTPNNPLAPLPALISPEVTPSSTSVPTTTQGTSSLRDVLPTTTTSVGDTILRPTETPTSTTDNLGGTAPPNGDQTAAGDEAGNGDSSGDNSSLDDHGHGNDPGGYDPDNPGQSDGVAGGNSNNGADGISPGDLSGGGGGGGTGSGGNTGGNSNGDNNDNGNGSGQGGNHGGKGNK